LAPPKFKLQRLGMVMEPEPGNLQEIEGVLNPAAARGPDGELYLFPRLVARGNYSHIGIARVCFNEAGDPVGVERLAIAVEPEADYERRPDGKGTSTAQFSWSPALVLKSNDIATLFGWRPGRKAAKSNHQPDWLCDGEEILNGKRKNCGYSQCHCTVPQHEHYCSDYCKDAPGEKESRSSATASTSPARLTSNWRKDLCQLGLGLQLRGRRLGRRDALDLLGTAKGFDLSRKTIAADLDAVRLTVTHVRALGVAWVIGLRLASYWGYAVFQQWVLLTRPRRPSQKPVVCCKV